MEVLKVVELKSMLKSRGLSCKGNKESLVKRLRDALNLQNERTSAPHSDDVEVRPDDSVSQVRSHTSNRTSATS